MTRFFAQHRPMLDGALAALRHRGFWTPFPENPRDRVYGETARADGAAAFEALRGQAFDLPGHPGTGRVGAERSPWTRLENRSLGIDYPAGDPEALPAAARAAAPAWAAASIEDRVGVCLEILVQLNKMSALIAHTVMHTTGQPLAMAFQAGGPHAQDRGLEAVALAWQEMTQTPATALWEKPGGPGGPGGKGPALVLEKHWRVVPRGVSLVIGCNTFPTWNSYPALFASLATGNAVIVKPHPAAILPLALTVRVARTVLAEAGFPANVVLLAADAPGAEITTALAAHPDTALIDYTGSAAFAGWLRDHARHARLYTEESGINSVVIAGTDDFRAMCDNLAFSLSLYSGQMCTTPRTVYIPRSGIETDEGTGSFDAVAAALALAIDRLLGDPDRAARICGAIANPATLDRVAAARGHGRVVRDSRVLPDGGATPLIVAVETAGDTHRGDTHHEVECFGPVCYLVPVADAATGIDQATALARRAGAITAALYDTDEARIQAATDKYAAAGVNLSVNLTGNIFVNQSAAFSDYHVTGANPAGNACLTDTAFVANRFRRAMWRRPKAA